MGKATRRTDYLICLLLIVATVAVYAQVRGFDFIILDDHFYVVANKHVQAGLSLDSITYAFRAFYQSNWHPLTWMSLMADAQIGGAGPGIYHLTNVGLHILNTLLLFAFLRIATGRPWRSGLVAFLFAVHPLHVESVAWVTERKDVLSTLFWLFAMLAYLWYTRRRTVRRYLLVAAMFALGLMAKPMLVTLPVVLLLLDIWPLSRGASELDEAIARPNWRGLILEKIPLFAMAAGSCVITMIAQSSGGSVSRVVDLPIGARISNALVAYIAYIVKMLWPLKLMPQYPHPARTLPEWWIAGSALALVLMTLTAIRAARKWPYVTAGWLWYVITLIPVIGLVQVGVQAMADRYTYVPLIGLFVIIAWGIPDLFAARRVAVPSAAWAAVGGALAIALTICTYTQVGYWRNSTSLFRHAVAVNGKSYLAHMLLGDSYAQDGNFKLAIPEFRMAKKLAPFSTQACYDLAQACCAVGRYQESAREFKRTLKAWPYRGDVHYQAGVLLQRMEQYDRAIKHYRYALSLKYVHSFVYTDMGTAYARDHDASNAKQCFEEALRLAPDDRRAQEGLAWAEEQLANRGQDR